MLLKVNHSKSLPTHLTSDQMVTVSQEIHDHILEVVTPLVDAYPQYHAIALTLGQLNTAIEQLEVAMNQRKYKSARSLRGVGGMDGLSGDASLTDELTLSALKRKAYERRRLMMNRFRFVLEWKLEDAKRLDITDTLAAVRMIGKLLDRRISGFEKGSYEESASQFKLFFQSVDSDPAALDALPILDLTVVYGDMKAAHEEFMTVHREQTALDAKREALPKVTTASQDIRRVVRALLNMLHFDVAAGSPAFSEVLGHVDEMIDKVRAVGKRRNTLDQKAKAAQADKADKADKADNADKADKDGNDGKDVASGSSDSGAADNATGDAGAPASASDQVAAAADAAQVGSVHADASQDGDNASPSSTTG